MKHLPLANPGYELLYEGFREWLDILGYSEKTVYNMPHHVREFLHHLEGAGVTRIGDMEQRHIRAYRSHIETRPNRRRGGGLSEKSVSMHIQAVEKLLAYLHHRGMHNVPVTGMNLQSPKRPEITPLSTEEMGLLYAATYTDTGNPKREALGARDRAMLSVHYGCGLRRNEGVHVNIDDINLETRVLHVRRGKNRRERFVPVGKTDAKRLEEYIHDHRPLLLKSKNESRLFISERGKPMTGGALYTRLKVLQLRTDDTALREKAMGLHTLRHSIATHLLGAGMSLDKIARFLGHSSLDSTQIYTHLTGKETAET